MTIADDIVYITDRSDSVAVSFTLDGRPIQVIGERGVYSDTGCERAGDLVPRAAGPFNYPTEMVPSPSGDIYVSDGYRNSRVHRFSKDGQLIQSWGQPGKSAPGEFHLPHSVLVDPEGKVYVCDRANRRVQIFSPDGEFIEMWTGMGGPNDISRDSDGIFYICEQEADGEPPHTSVRDGSGNVLARWPTRHAHGLWVDSRGDHLSGPHHQPQRRQVRANRVERVDIQFNAEGEPSHLSILILTMVDSPPDLIERPGRRLVLCLPFDGWSSPTSSWCKVHSGFNDTFPVSIASVCAE